MIGGQVIKNSFPFFANIASNKGYCGSTLIAPNVLVTAAHCEVSVGSDKAIFNSHNSIRFTNKHIKVGIKQFIKHEKYTNSSFSYDIALAVLDSDVSSEYSVKLADSEDLVDGDDYTLVGFGHTKEGRPNELGVLKSIQTKKLSQEECGKMDGNMEVDHICTNVPDQGKFIFLL